MSELRRILTSARTAYLAQRFPGDLARGVALTSNVPRILFLCGTIGAGAIAAALLLFVSHPGGAPATMSPAPSMSLVRNIPMLQPKLAFDVPGLSALNRLPSLPEELMIAPPVDRVVPEGVRDMFRGHGSRKEMSASQSPA